MSFDFSRLRSLTVRRIQQALVADSFVLTRQRGSHRQFSHADSRRVTLTFYHASDTFPLGTLRSIIELQAKWTESDLLRLRLLK